MSAPEPLSPQQQRRLDELSRRALLGGLAAAGAAAAATGRPGPSAIIPGAGGGVMMSLWERTPCAGCGRDLCWLPGQASHPGCGHGDCSAQGRAVRRGLG